MLPILDFYMRQYRENNQDENDPRRRLRLQRRILRDTSDPFALPENRFIELFRLNKLLVRNLIINLRAHLHEPRYQSGLSVETKVLTALRFYATGCYQRAVGEDYHLGLSQTSVHRCIHEVTDCIDIHLSEQHIQFPTTMREFNINKEIFMRQFHFPGVIGAIDCTHIAILKPAVEEYNFINRKGFHSLNVQLICNSSLKILNVNANFPGSSHDSFIWRQSQIRERLQQLYQNGARGCWLIGDSGYPLEPYLVTPFLNPQENSPEARYNFRHASARNCIERCIGLLKTRFRCILKERTARYAPQFVGSLINTCATLHNICIDNNIPILGDIEEPAEVAVIPVNLINHNMNLLHEGRNVRQMIVNRYFN